MDMPALLDLYIGNNDNSSTGRTDNATASGRTSVVDPDQLSRIDEGDEDDEAPEWFAADVWHTCSPEQKAFIKEVEKEAVEPETEHTDGINVMQHFSNFSNEENWTAEWGKEVSVSGPVAVSVTDSPAPSGTQATTQT